MSESGSPHESFDRKRSVGAVTLIALAVLALGLFVGCTVVLPRYLAASDLDQAKITPTDRAARIAMVTAIATATAQPASITHVGTRAGRCRNHAMLMAVTRTGPPLSRIPRPTRVG